MKGKYKRTKGWCYGCDANIVEGGKKCSVCGAKYFIEKIKKIPRNKIIESFETEKI